MASIKTCRIIGYSYAGICIICSLLLLINSGHMVKVNDRFSERSTVSITCVLTLVFSLITMLLNIFLICGLIMHRANFVKFYHRFVTTIYAIVSIGLFIGCIVLGFAIGNEASASYAETHCGILVGATIGFCIMIKVATLWYMLVLWILKCMIEVIKYDAAQMTSTEDGVIIPDLM